MYIEETLEEINKKLEKIENNIDNLRHINKLDNLEKLNLTTKEVCKLLRISMSKLTELTNQKKIPFFRIGRKKLFPRELLNEWIINMAKNNYERIPEKYDEDYILERLKEFREFEE